jgi:hypothetical protein
MLVQKPLVHIHIHSSSLEAHLKLRYPPQKKFEYLYYPSTDDLSSFHQVVRQLWVLLDFELKDLGIFLPTTL